MKLEGAEVKNVYGICSKIGGESKAPLRLRIPYYQRPYKWTTQHIENLFADFFQNLADSEEKEYFVGSVVLVKTDKDEFYEVVDGQQRTTTVFLLNYLNFLLQRSYIEELLVTQKIAAISQAVEGLCETLKMLVIMSDSEQVVLDDFCKGISERLNSIFEIDDPAEKDEAAEKLLGEFRQLFGLPLSKDFSQRTIYAEMASADTEAFISKYRLAIKYDRESYNTLLKKALGSICILYSNAYKPECVITKEIEKESPLEIYVSALEQEFCCLIERANDADQPDKVINKMIKDIKCMLDNLSFCKILTGNEHDAYTLFEVLNDRALAVDDLELVKNMFFKKYCNCSADSDDKKDKHIEELDGLWGDIIFRGTGATQTQLIAYCSSVYLTGTTELVTNKGQRYRDVLQEKYLNRKKTYEYSDIRFDFQIIQAVRVISEKANLHYQTTHRYALAAENDINRSCVYKALNLIHAMDYKAVMPALVNVIIRTYCDAHPDKPINMDSFGMYLDEIMGSGKKCEYQHVYECADLLRKAILLSKDYKLPREIAKNVIEHNYREKVDYSAIKLSVDDQEELDKEYKSWTSSWRYGSEKQNFRLKVLFLDLYKTEKIDGELKFSVAKYTLSSDVDVALDHLDAQNIDGAAKEKYFIPNNQSRDREDYIDSMGNMMILDGKNNGDKNNKPLAQALEYHKKLANHWLVTEIETMINDDKYSIEISTGSGKCRVAKDEFFDERTKRLQKYFYAIINRKSEEDAVKIGD